MQLTQLRNFLAVVEAGSIRGAARALRISQPALTRSIRQLEVELQTKLLERTGRGIVATPAGRAFFSRSRMIHHEIGKAREELAQIANQSVGSVSFGVSPQAAIHLVPPGIARFRREHPSVDVRIVDGLSHLLLPLLRDGTLDFVIGPRPQEAASPSIKAHPLFTNRIVIGARRGHALRGAKSLRDLLDANWVVFTPSGLAGAMIPDLFAKHGLPAPKSVVRSDSYVAMLALLAQTELIGALSHMLFEQRLARQYFEQFEIKERLPEFTLCLFLRTDSPLTPVAAAMVTAMKEAASRLAFSKPAK